MSSTPAWTEVRVLVPTGWHELVADALAVTPCTTVSVGNPSIGQSLPPDGHEFVRTFIAEEDDTPELREEIRSTLSTLAIRSGDEDLEGLQLDFKRLPPEDYATSWKKSWKPFRVGRLAVIPPWDDREVRSSDTVLRLEPGGSFGSGRHATTRDCLKTLMSRMQGGERVLDAGSGSGILSVTAALLGAADTFGFDVDENAPRAGRRLAEQNGVGDRCRFTRGGFDVLEDGVVYDVVLANIYSDVIQQYAGALRERLAPSGWFAFSGCPVHHRDATVAAILDAGLLIESERSRGRWHTFAGRHG